MKTAILAAIGGAIVVLAANVIFFSPAEQPLGAGAGPDEYNRQFFHDNVEIGGGVTATTSAGTVTYTAANIVNSRLINHIATGATTASLPTKAALDAMGFIKTAGDTYSMFIYASTTAITIAGNTGVNLENASTTNAISASGMARLEFVRLPANESSNIEVLMIAAE